MKTQFSVAVSEKTKRKAEHEKSPRRSVGIEGTYYTTVPKKVGNVNFSSLLPFDVGPRNKNFESSKRISSSFIDFGQILNQFKSPHLASRKIKLV